MPATVPSRCAAAHGVTHPADAHARGSAHDESRRARRRRARPRTVARPARVADADDVPADGARRRRDRRRLRRHSGGARRRQRDRALPRAELHRGGGARTSRAAASRSTPAEPAAAAERWRTKRGEPHASRGVELGLMGFSVLIAAIGIGLAWRFYVTQPGDLGAAGRAVRRRAPHAVEQVLRGRALRRDGHRRHDGVAAAGCGPSIATSSTARSTARAG